jgi:hypothetical protein
MNQFRAGSFPGKKEYEDKVRGYCRNAEERNIAIKLFDDGFNNFEKNIQALRSISANNAKIDYETLKMTIEYGF